MKCCHPGRSPSWDRHWNGQESEHDGTGPRSCVNALARRYAALAGALRPRDRGFSLMNLSWTITALSSGTGLPAVDASAAAGTPPRAARLKRRRPALGVSTPTKAVREAIVVLWEASDRICGKPRTEERRYRRCYRRGGWNPTLPPSVRLGAEIRAAVLAMSAATIDRSLRDRSGNKLAAGTAPSDQAAPFVDSPQHSGAHARLGRGTTRLNRGSSRPKAWLRISGPVANGSFVSDAYCHRHRYHGMDLECAPLLYREKPGPRPCFREVQYFACEAVRSAMRRGMLPFEQLKGFDTDRMTADVL